MEHILFLEVPLVQVFVQVKHLWAHHMHLSCVHLAHIHLEEDLIVKIALQDICVHNHLLLQYLVKVDGILFLDQQIVLFVLLDIFVKLLINLL